MRTPLVDPTFEYLQVEPPTPNSAGSVVSVSGSTAQVKFRGNTVSARFPAAGTLAAGDSVSMVNTDGVWWALKMDAGYPSRYPRNLSDFNATNPASVLLCYLLKDNPRTYTYRACVVLAVLSASLLSISLEGRTLSVGVEYAGVAQTTTGISAGDTVLAYHKAPGQWVALAKATTQAAIVRLYWTGAVTAISGPTGWDVTGLYVGVGAATFGGATSLPYDLTFDMTLLRPLWSMSAPVPVGGKYTIPAGTAIPHFEPVTLFWAHVGGDITTEWSNDFLLGANAEITYPAPVGAVVQSWVEGIPYPNPLHL